MTKQKYKYVRDKISKETLEVMFAAGKTIDAAATELGHPFGVVKYYCIKYGVKMRKEPKQRDVAVISKEDLIQELEAGKSYGEIAGLVGYRIDTVIAYAKKYGLLETYPCEVDRNIRHKTDLLGQTLGMITVLSYGYVFKTNTYWNCRCECGNELVLCGKHLRSGRSRSCGCDLKLKRLLKNGFGDIPGYCLKKIKDSASARGLAMELTKEYIWELYLRQNKKCAFSGEPISFATVSGGRHDYTTTASLDRINSDIGYIEGNVQWVHKHINAMKWNLEDSAFIEICGKIAAFRLGYGPKNDTTDCQ